MAIMKQTKRKVRGTQWVTPAAFPAITPEKESKMIIIDNEENGEMLKKTPDKEGMGAKLVTTGKKPAAKGESSAITARWPLHKAGATPEDQPSAAIPMMIAWLLGTPKGGTPATPGEKQKRESPAQVVKKIHQDWDRDGPADEDEELAGDKEKEENEWSQDKDFEPGDEEEEEEEIGEPKTSKVTPKTSGKKKPTRNPVKTTTTQGWRKSGAVRLSQPGAPCSAKEEDQLQQDHQQAELYLNQCEKATKFFLTSIRQQTEEKLAQPYREYIQALINIVGKPVWPKIAEADMDAIVRLVRDPEGCCISKGKGHVEPKAQVVKYDDKGNETDKETHGTDRLRC